jgi:hypothetical protein
VTHLVRGGQTRTRAPRDPRGHRVVPAADVVVLPNNKNIIASAQQARRARARGRSAVAVVAAGRGRRAGAQPRPLVRGRTRRRWSARSPPFARRKSHARYAQRRSFGRAVAVGQAIGIVEGALRVVATACPPPCASASGRCCRTKRAC